MARLGLITTGQGPRSEYEAYHNNVLSQLELKPVEIVITHALDGISQDELNVLYARAGEWCIGCHVDAKDTEQDRTGKGRREIFVARERFIPLVQKCIDELERVGEVDAIVFCCVEEYPAGSLQSAKPLVLPWLATASQVRGFVEGREEVTNIGVVVPSEMHISQVRDTWSRIPWRVVPRVGVVPFGQSSVDMANGITKQMAAVDLVVMWGYGMGIAPNDAREMLAQLEEILEAPVITPHLVSTIAVRQFLRPSFDDRFYAGLA